MVQKLGRRASFLEIFSPLILKANMKIRKVFDGVISRKYDGFMSANLEVLRRYVTFVIPVTSSSAHAPPSDNHIRVNEKSHQGLGDHSGMYCSSRRKDIFWMVDLFASHVMTCRDRVFVNLEVSPL